VRERQTERKRDGQREEEEGGGGGEIQTETAHYTLTKCHPHPTEKNIKKEN
jgi:hypothetical protein